MKQREQMTMDAFIARHGIRLTLKETGTRPDETEWPAGSRHFRATLHCGKRRMTVPFSQGPGVGLEPEVANVLDAVAADASYADHQSFEDFCSELGYDTDSRKAERTYKACVKESDGLRRLLGDRDFETLLYRVEKL